MSSKKIISFLFLLGINFLYKIISNTFAPNNFEKTLSNKFKSNLEFIFENNYNTEQINLLVKNKFFI